MNSLSMTMKMNSMMITSFGLLTSIFYAPNAAKDLLAP